MPKQKRLDGIEAPRFKLPQECRDVVLRCYQDWIERYQLKPTWGKAEWTALHESYKALVSAHGKDRDAATRDMLIRWRRYLDRSSYSGHPPRLFRRDLDSFYARPEREIEEGGGFYSPDDPRAQNGPARKGGTP